LKPIRLVSGFVTVGFWTLASRLLGFVRDIMIAAYLGTGPVAEAFLIAFSLPNMFRRFFAEGAFNMAFVPMFSKKLEADDGALDFARDAFVGMTVILTFVSILGVIFMPALVYAMASGFAGDERFDLAVEYGRLTFPYILFISLAALLSGVLNATGRFMAAAAAPVLLNLIFIASILISVVLGRPASDALGMGLDQSLGLRVGDSLALSVPLAGAAQMALVWWAAARAGFPLRLRRPRMTPELKRLAIIAGPAALAGGVVQINLLVGRQVASFFDGAVAWLNYADRLYQLPLLVNAGLAIGLSTYIGFIAAAFGTTLAGWATVAQLAWGARGMGDAARTDARFRGRLWRIVLASVLMSVVLAASMVLLNPFFGIPHLRYAALALLILLGVVTYGLFGQMLGAFRLGDFRRALRR
jgi:putative peptidoglycan lipid II flippase